MNSPTEGLVLVDVLAGEGEDFDVSFLERNQHPVNVCHGPAIGRLCPLLGEDRWASSDSSPRVPHPAPPD